MLQKAKSALLLALAPSRHWLPHPTCGRQSIYSAHGSWLLSTKMAVLCQLQVPLAALLPGVFPAAPGCSKPGAQA